MKSNNMLSKGVLVSLLLVAAMVGLPAQNQTVSVVTTTTDLAHFAERIGGDRVEVRALIGGDQDPHYFDARPDFIRHVNRADLFVEVGLDLEIGWAPLVLRRARNRDVMQGERGYVDASIGVDVLEVPEGRADRSGGDIHLFGNPHYWLDPLNASIMARNIRDGLIRVDPAARGLYEDNYRIFHQDMRRLAEDQMRQFAPYRGLKVAVYHNEFSYLEHRFGFEVVATIEEKPGVPPPGRYLREVTEQLRQEGVDIIVLAPWSPSQYADRVARTIGAEVIRLPVSVKSEPGIDSYEDVIRIGLSRLREAAR